MEFSVEKNGTVWQEGRDLRTQACAEMRYGFLISAMCTLLAMPPAAAFAELGMIYFCHEKIKVSPYGNTFIFWLITVILIQKTIPRRDSAAFQPHNVL